jgi:hypothetical protein
MVSTRKALQPMRAASIWPRLKARLATSRANAPEVSTASGSDIARFVPAQT